MPISVKNIDCTISRGAVENFIDDCLSDIEEEKQTVDELTTTEGN